MQFLIDNFNLYLAMSLSSIFLIACFYLLLMDWRSPLNRLTAITMLVLAGNLFLDSTWLKWLFLNNSWLAEIAGAYLGISYLLAFAIQLAYIFRKTNREPKKQAAWYLFLGSIPAAAFYATYLFVEKEPVLIALSNLALGGAVFKSFTFLKGFQRRNRNGVFLFKLVASCLVFALPAIILVYLVALNQNYSEKTASIRKELELKGQIIFHRTQGWISSTQKALDLISFIAESQEPSLSLTNRSFEEISDIYPILGSAMIFDLQGTVIAQSGESSTGNVGGEEWFMQAVKTNSHVYKIQTGAQEGSSLIVARRYQNARSIPGVVMLSIQLDTLIPSILDDPWGEEAKIYLIHREQNIIISNASSDSEVGFEDLLAFQSMEPKGETWFTFTSPVGDGWEVVYQILDQRGSALRINFGVIGTVFLGVLILVVGVGIAARSLSKPVGEFYKASDEIDTAGLSYEIHVSSDDEFGYLGEAINRILKKIKEIDQSREKKFVDTQAQLDRLRTHTLVITKVAQAALSYRDLQNYLNEVTILISSILNYSHVGIFIIDDSGEYAVLRAATSEAGRKLLEKGFKVAVGQASVVGFVASTGRPRLVQGLLPEIISSQNSDNSRARAEISLPLRASGKILGVLDVQAPQGLAFSKDDQDALGILADQIAFTIDHSMRISENEASFQGLMALQKDETARIWQEKLKKCSKVFRYNRLVVDSSDSRSFASRQAKPSSPGHQFEVPIMLRGQTIGSLVLRREEDQPSWSEEDLARAIDAINQIVPALENARLMDEIENRAEMEKQVGNISARIQGSLILENVMRITVEELSKVINANRIRMRINVQELDMSSEYKA
jgi:GAF domain-containing protein